MPRPSRRRFPSAVAVLPAVVAASAVPASAADAFVPVHVADLPADTGMLLAEDLDGDHVVDLAVGSACAVHVLRGHGDATFGASAAFPTGAGCSGALPSLAAGDVDGDGARDLIVANADERVVRVLHGDGHGAFGTAAPVPTASGEPVLGAAATDLNHDGRADVVVSERVSGDPGGADLAVLLATDSGFEPGVRYAGAFRDAGEPTIGDVDGDGAPDVLAGVERCLAPPTCEAGVIAFHGNGDGTIGVDGGDGRPSGAFAATVRGMPEMLVAARLRGLPRDDVVAFVPGLQTLLGNPDGTLSAQPFAGAAPGRGATADFDRDGHLDVAAGIDAVAVLLGTGQGDFDTEGVIAVPSRVASLALTDVNADAWPDVIAVGEDSRVDVVLNTPTGALDAEGIDFGAAAVGTATAAEVVTVFNDGVRPLRVRGARLGGADAPSFRMTSDDCSGTALGLLEACEIAVAFAPGAAGAKHGALVVSTDDPNGDLTAALVGTATGGAPSAPGSRTSAPGPATPPRSGAPPAFGPAPTAAGRPDRAAPRVRSRIAPQRLGGGPAARPAPPAPLLGALHRDRPPRPGPHGGARGRAASPRRGGRSRRGAARHGDAGRRVHRRRPAPAAGSHGRSPGGAAEPARHRGRGGRERQPRARDAPDGAPAEPLRQGGAHLVPAGAPPAAGRGQGHRAARQPSTAARASKTAGGPATSRLPRQPVAGEIVVRRPRRRAAGDPAEAVPAVDVRLDVAEQPPAGDVAEAERARAVAQVDAAGA